MKKVDPFTFISITESHTFDYSSFSWECVRNNPEFQKSYSEIWEQDAKWLLGKALLNDIVLHVYEKSLTSVYGDFNELVIEIPLPVCKMMRPDRLELLTITVIEMVPEELRPLFEDRYMVAISHYKPILETIVDLISGRNKPLMTVSAHSLEIIKTELRRHECEISYLRYPELWQILSMSFGLPPFLVHKQRQLLDDRWK